MIYMNLFKKGNKKFHFTKCLEMTKYIIQGNYRNSSQNLFQLFYVLLFYFKEIKTNPYKLAILIT